MNKSITFLATLLALALGTTAAAAQAAREGEVGTPAPKAESAPKAEKAQPSEAPGYMNAFACEPLKTPVQVEVELLDNTEENMRLHGVFVEALAKAGVKVVPGAKLVLSLDIERLREGQLRKPGDLVDVRVGGGGGTDGPEGSTDDDAYARVHMNIWSNQRDSVIGGRREGAQQDPTDQLHVTIDVNSRDDGRCLWRGEAIYDLEVGDPRRIGPALMHYLARQVGKPASNKPVRLNY